MKLINEDGNDFSNEGLVNFAIMLEFVYASEIVAYRVSDALQAIGMRNSLIQQKKQALNTARRQIESAMKNLEVAFDTTFERVFDMDKGNEKARSEYVQGVANEIIRLVLIYYSRGDGEPGKRESMQKALMNFKPSKENIVDLESMLKFYNFKI